MKKMMTMLLLNVVVFNVFALNVLDNVDKTDKGVIVKNAVLFIRPFDMYSNYKNDLYGICIESQSAFSSLWGLRTNTDYLANENTFKVNLTIGPQINLTNNVLEGLLIGIYPGVEFSTSYSQYFQPKVLAEITYNYNIANNWGVGVYLNADILQMQKLSVGMKIGRYLSNSYYHN
jgi:hypothetical protein